MIRPAAIFGFILTLACYAGQVCAEPLSSETATDKKAQWLKNCIWEIERTMVLYRVINENGYSAKLETEAQERLWQLSPGTERFKAAEKHRDDLRKQQADREGDIEDKLLQKCMAAGGYSYVVDAKVDHCKINPKLSVVLNRIPDCWEQMK
jgi:hypothetical protein